MLQTSRPSARAVLNSTSKPLELVQININDVMGGRFNGYSIRKALGEEGVRSTHLVWNRSVDDPQVKTLTPYPGTRAFVKWAAKLEKQWSLQSILQVQSFLTAVQREFRRADVAHYHIIYDDFFSLHALPLLTRMKPGVWSWHDPWPMTGHCSHPLGCEGWKTGCQTCPHLDYFFPLKEDKAGLNFQHKLATMERSRIDIVLASPWMMRMAEQSPIAATARLHHIPFGLDLDVYKPRPASDSRRRLGIEDGRTVIAVRADTNPYKGLTYFQEALEMLGDSHSLCILAIQGMGHFDHYLGRHQVIETGWVNDDDLIVDALSAADIFIMPSIADSFGMMAVEAMACGAAVVVFEGTALPEVTFAPHVGASVPARDSSALANTIRQLIENPEERQVRQERGLEAVKTHYDQKLYVRRLANLYREVAARH